MSDQLDSRRLLLFSHETTLSGAPLALAHLAGWLHDHGRSVVVAAPEPGPIAELLQARGIEVILDSSFLTDPARARLNELVRGYDLVVANTLASWPMVRASHAAGVPVIWYLHETLVAFDLIRKIPAIEPTFALADLLITPTRQTARIYQDIARTKVEVVPYGIPDAAAIAATKRTTDAVSFVALGSYEPRKGQDILVEAIARLAPEVRSRGRFTMAGRVLDQSFFEKLSARAAGLENVELGGALDHAGSLQLLADADVLICPSRDETMPISIIEAMSLGKTVISANVGGVSEWLRDGVNGRVVPPNDPEALARAMSECVNDPDSAPGVRRGRAKNFFAALHPRAFRRTFCGRDRPHDQGPGAGAGRRAAPVRRMDLAVRHTSKRRPHRIETRTPRAPRASAHFHSPAGLQSRPPVAGRGDRFGEGAELRALGALHRG